MKIMLIADGRSPITRRWVETMLSVKIDVCLVSTYPCPRPENVSGFYIIPVAFAGFGRKKKASPPAASQSGQPAAAPSGRKGLIARFRPRLLKIRYLIGPLTVPFYGIKLRRIIKKVNPDAVHALRIPFEGMLGACLPKGIPFAVSIWGNDLTLHAKGSALMGRETKKVLRRADALAADAARDIRLGKIWGFDPEKQTLVVPGNGGISLSDICLTADDGQIHLGWLPQDWHIVINPRGFRTGSVRSDTFFKSIPIVISRMPNTLFLCCSMAGQPEALEWVDKLKIEKNVVLLPTLNQNDLWPLFRRAECTVSISQHDGTPNSLLEAMSLGCFPVAGDIESIREWITPGVNGILVEPDSPEQLANAILCAVSNPKLRADAADANRALIEKRAEKSIVAAAVAAFYRRLAGK